MTDAELSKYLRQNPPRRDGTPGTYCLRFFVLPDNPAHKPRRVEIGLSTNVKEEALRHAQTLLLGIYALGARFSGRIALKGPYRELTRVDDALPDRRTNYRAALPPRGELDAPPPRGGKCQP